MGGRKLGLMSVGFGMMVYAAVHITQLRKNAEDHKIEGHELKNDGLVYPYTSNRSVLRKRFEF